jgi:hypothetical protein
MAGKMKDKGLFRVSVYFSESDLASLVKETEKAGFRRVGIPIKIQKPHGLPDEWLANTDGVSRFLKHCVEYWRRHETERLEEATRIAEQERQLAERKVKLGLP